VEVCFGVAVEGVPGDRDCLGEEPERDGPLHGFLDAVAGLPDAVGLGLLVSRLDSPAAVVACDQHGRESTWVGAGQRDVEVFLAPGVADQDHLDRAGIERRAQPSSSMLTPRGAPQHLSWEVL